MPGGVRLCAGAFGLRSGPPGASGDAGCAETAGRHDVDPGRAAALRRSGLLKLADNFENHVAIAQEGGIQALLRLGRERTTDEELQYKAALTVGTLASNAVKMMPPTAETHGTGAKRMVRSDIGFGAAAMLQGRVAGEARKGREETLAYLEKTTQQDAASGEAKKGG